MLEKSSSEKLILTSLCWPFIMADDQEEIQKILVRRGLAWESSPCRRPQLTEAGNELLMKTLSKEVLIQIAGPLNAEQMKDTLRTIKELINMLDMDHLKKTTPAKQ